MQNFNLKKYLLANPLTVAFIVLCVILSIASPYFLTINNWSNILLQSSIIGLLAIGTTYVMLGGGIDLSIASSMALGGMLAAAIQNYSFLLAICIPLVVGAMIGFVNGFVISRTKVQPFIFTLGMGTFIRGLVYFFTDGETLYDLSDTFLKISNGFIGRIPVPVCILGLIAIISFIILTYKKFGRYTYAIGGNEEAARLSGVKTDKIKIQLYIICGFLAGLAGIVLTSRLHSAEPMAGIGIELDAVAAVVIGGTSMRGGKGTIIGTIIGVLILGVVNNGLNIMNVSPYLQQVVKGLIIMLAVLSDKGGKNMA